ncbi:MAG: phosphoribosylanthranilate isomerase [Acidobacteriota bacterium]|nr:phosphoribosylanthranilate isomerase [Acidobacteriota bacterium]
MTLIKICGITRLEDALLATRLGVHALGFVLWAGSPRAVGLSAVKAMLGRLPPLVTPVGVFVDPSEAEILEARAAGIHVAQVHGRAPALPPGMPLIQATHLSAGEGDVSPDAPCAAALLLDAHDPVLQGGTGRTIDWARARTVAARRPVILAGGLTPGNVGAAIAAVGPLGVDVSSGVEQSPGAKNPDKLAAFVAAVRAQA